MKYGVNGNQAHVLLGEIKSDIKWVMSNLEAVRSDQKQLDHRVSALEGRSQPKLPWPITLRVSLGVIPLALALSGRMEWHVALQALRALIE